MDLPKEIFCTRLKRGNACNVTLKSFRNTKKREIITDEANYN